MKDPSRSLGMIFLYHYEDTFHFLSFRESPFHFLPFRFCHSEEAKRRGILIVDKR